MNIEEQLTELEKAGVTIEDASLLRGVFTHFVGARKENLPDDPLSRLLLEEFNQLGLALDESKVQASAIVRNVLLSRHLATLLIDESGDLNLVWVNKAIFLLQDHLYSLGPNAHLEARRREHVLFILKQLSEDESLRVLLNKVDRPYQHPQAEELIRATLRLDRKEVIQAYHAKRAVLSAMFTFLRQSVGSCFATAACIVLHTEQPHQFVKDLTELLSTGRLKRIFEGEEFAAPLSVSFGAGDLRRYITLSKDFEKSSCPIWLSPGLINALETVSVLEKEIPLPQKRERLKHLIVKALRQEKETLSIEELIQELLLDHFDLTPEQVQEVLDRPSGMIHSGILIQSGGSQKGKPIGDRVNHFFSAMEEAKKSFVALADNALLKAWEFSVASFTEMKANFSKWNLYTSLGLSAHDQGGLGQKLFQILQEKLSEENRKIQEYQDQYEELYTQLKYLEGRIRRARDEREAAWLKPEYQSRRNEFNTFEEMRNKAHYRAESFANLFDVLIHTYLQLFPQYFQEVYDADMHHFDVGLYDDSPAGFQLLYKHGRASTSAWTPVKSLQEFTNALQSFLSSTEHEIVNDPVMKGFERDISELVSACIGHVKTDEFLESALYRMAAAKGGRLPKKPLENLDLVEKKPWAYTSGGSLETLVQTYFRLPRRPDMEGRWVENPTELLIFILDTLKAVPEKTLELYEEDPGRSMLMTSPTHAFILKPGKEELKEGWKTSAYTYIWCRDYWIQPAIDRVSKIQLDQEMIEFLTQHFRAFFPEELHEAYDREIRISAKRLHPKNFRAEFWKALRENPELFGFAKQILTRDRVDGELFKLLPLTHRFKLKAQVESVIERLEGLSDAEKKSALEWYEKLERGFVKSEVFSAEGVRNLLKTLVLLVKQETTTKTNFHWEIHRLLQEEGFALSRPILFADTNWVSSEFGFVVNPGTELLEFWRVDPSGTYGSPLSDWKQWLNGSRKDIPWEIYNKPEEVLFPQEERDIFRRI